MRRLLAVLPLALVASGWVKPAVPTTVKPVGDAAQKLDYLIVEVNGSSRIVRDGGEIQVVKGDSVLIRDASLVDKRFEVAKVDVIGYQSPRGGVDDRGFKIDTGKELSPKSSEGKKGERYAVLARSKAGLHGAVYLRLVDPVLRFAELTINGQPRVMRDGEPLEVRATDLVKVSRVSTNLEKDDGVLFQIVEARPKSKGQAHFEIRFLRGELLFARIPLTIDKTSQ